MAATEVIRFPFTVQPNRGRTLAVTPSPSVSSVDSGTPCFDLSEWPTYSRYVPVATGRGKQ